MQGGFRRIKMPFSTTNDTIRHEMISILLEQPDQQLPAIEWYRELLRRIPTDPNVTAESLCLDMGFDEKTIIKIGSGVKTV
jgi:hypothetical protein